MTPGFDQGLLEVCDSRKSAIINNELKRLNIDIAALQETRLADEGKIRESDYTFFWRGKPAEERRLYGVGFAVRNTLLPQIVEPTGGSERILRLSLHTSSGTANLLSIYAPTQMADSDIKDQFYDELESELSSIPRSEELFLLGDFNARVGSDREAWFDCLGPYGVGKMNDNGQRLLELCCNQGLCIGNTFFKGSLRRRVSWRHPRSGHWHQLDMIITRRSFIGSFLKVRSYHSADCDTDHAMVVGKLRLQPRKPETTSNACIQKIDVNKLSDPKVKRGLLMKLQEMTMGGDSIEDKWSSIHNAINECAKEEIGPSKRPNNDWFEENLHIMQPKIDDKRKAYLNHKQSPNAENLHLLRQARNATQQTARDCANAYWIELCARIQTDADTGNIRGMYEGMRKAFGPVPAKRSPIKSKEGSILRTREEQMQRWTEHYSDIYSRQYHIPEDTLSGIPQLPVLEELDITPTREELETAIDSASVGKSPGQDGIPVEILKHCKEALLGPLHELLVECWETGQVPQNFKDSKLITLYKNKGDRAVCDNYRGISLLSTAGKVAARVVLRRLQVLANQIYPESQCGFRAERSTIDMIFTLAQLQEKCREQHRPLYVAFVDLTKAFDLVTRSGLYEVLRKVGCPPKMLHIIRAFHDGMQCAVQFDGNLSSPFPVGSGVKQGCVLAPTLFGIFFSVVLRDAFEECEEGILLHTRSDGSLFNLSRLKAKTKIRKTMVRELLFADDAAFVSHSETGLQEMMDLFADSCSKFGLTISLTKTEVMGQGVAEAPNILLGQHNLKTVNEFTYLGTTISQAVSLDTELGRRIGKASGAMARLSERVWNNVKLRTTTKIAVYRACVLSTLLYGSESWTAYAKQEHRLNAFHLRNLRRILRIRWQDKVTNSIVLERADICSVYGLLTQRRMRWLGHVSRMPDGRIPKDVLYGELATGGRSVGRPFLRFKDVCKRDMKFAEMDVNSWESVAADRRLWRGAVESAVAGAERKRSIAAAAKRNRRHVRQTDLTGTDQVTSFPCGRCGKICRSRIGLYSHSRVCQPTS